MLMDMVMTFFFSFFFCLNYSFYFLWLFFIIVRDLFFDFGYEEKSSRGEESELAEGKVESNSTLWKKRHYLAFVAS